MNTNSFSQMLKHLTNRNFGPGDVRISITYSPPPARVPNVADVFAAAAVIQRFCNNRKGDHACKYCPIRENCTLEPYSWVMPCTSCGKDAEPRIKCRWKGPVCLSCCDSCYSSEPFPCPEREAYERGRNDDV